MANTLTGDFDVVAEFTTLAVNRLLAAMHQCERFLHSISVRVDDNPPPGVKTPRPTVVGTVDGFGDAVANQNQIGRPNPSPGSLAATDPVSSRLGGIVNPDVLTFAQPVFTPSHISGIAQLQLFPPTLDVPQAADANLTVRMNLMSRFFPDKGTTRLAEFIRGDLQISAPVNKVATGRVHVLDVDFKAAEAGISFTPSYSSQTLTAEDLAAIDLCIQNGLRTSFLPSSVMLPSSIADVQLKTLPGAIAVLLDLNDHTPASTTTSVTNVFLTGADDFAFAVGRDYLLNTFRLISDNILAQQIPPVKFTVDLSFWGVGTTLHYSYAIQLYTAAFDLQNGKMVLTITGHAGPAQHAPSEFNFTVTVDFSLLPAGNTVALEVGNVSVDTDSSIASIVDFFTSDITNSVKDAIAGAIAATGADGMVNTTFNADTNLGNFLNAQLNPPDGSTPAQPQHVFLVYNSVDIQPAGIVLHGSLLVFDWPAPYVEFEQIPANTTGIHVGPGVIVPQGPDYSALKTWIPGGTITQYEWMVQGQEQAYPFDIDSNRFVLLHSGPSHAASAVLDGAASATPVPGYLPLCLTITGTRISNYGSPIVYQPVTATICGVTKFTIGGLVAVSGGSAAVPMLAITRPGPSGQVVVSGHAAAQVDQTGATAPNLIVHFADSKSVGGLQVLTEALVSSKRSDAPTAIIAVLTPDQLSRAPYAPGIVYADDQESWHNALGLKTAHRPLTLIVSPRGAITWQHEGAIEPDKLAAALTKRLVSRGAVKVTLPRLNLRIAQPAPSFMFEYAPGREMPLSKLKGQSLVLVFWKSSIRASIQAVRDLQNAWSSTKSPALVVLAVNDGEDPEVARGVAAESGFTAILVTDPKREIALAYGVSLWPTIVTVSPAGAVTGIRYGYVPGEPGSPTKSASAEG